MRTPGGRAFLLKRIRTYSDEAQEQLSLDALPNITIGLYWGLNP